jgi:hypothetical protein
MQRFFAKYEFQSPYLLCCSDCEPLTMQELLAAADEDALSRCAAQQHAQHPNHINSRFLHHQAKAAAAEQVDLLQ